MYTKSSNIEIMEGDKTDEIIEERFKSPLLNYQKKISGTNERK